MNNTKDMICMVLFVKLPSGFVDSSGFVCSGWLEMRMVQSEPEPEQPASQHSERDDMTAAKLVVTVGDTAVCVSSLHVLAQSTTLL